MLLESVRNFTILTAFQIIMSIMSITSLYLVGKIKIKYLIYSNIVTLCNQFLWFGYCLYTKQFGLLPITVCYFFLSISNLLKIRRENRKPNAPLSSVYIYLNKISLFICTWLIIIFIALVCAGAVVAFGYLLYEVINKWVI